MSEPTVRNRMGEGLRRYAAPLRFSLRVSLAGVIAYVIAGLMNIPLRGLWVVLTAVAVMQMSIGASLNATIQYVIGTLGGIVYASALALVIPHENIAALAGLLALTLAPLAFASALSPSFRVAPFTGALVLLIAGQLGDGPIHAAVFRLLEVVLGGFIAVTISVLVLPERAHELGIDMAAGILKKLAGTLPMLLKGYTQQLDIAEARRLQNDLGQSLAALQAHADSSKAERLLSLVPREESGALMRNLLRLRNDLVIIARAAVEPLPATIAARLGPLIERVSASVVAYLDTSRAALVAHGAAPSLEAFTAAHCAFASEVAALRRESAMRGLAISELERLFTLSFGLEQLERNLSDLAQRVDESSEHKG